MARRILIAGNWKMNKTIAEGESFADSLKTLVGGHDCEFAVFPPFFSVVVVSARLEGTGVIVGAQDLFWEKTGAFTGEISAEMIADAGGTAVIVGHSERRHVIGETNDIVAKKLKAALDAGLVPVLCVGETLEDRDSGDAEPVVRIQLESAVAGLTVHEVARVILAYEPVWAIGTGRTAWPEDADSMHRFIRTFVANRFDDDLAASIRILYGGSVKPENANGLLGKEDIDGALIGGASLELDMFLGIAAAAGKAS